jgi:hypothetical protein
LVEFQAQHPQIRTNRRRKPFTCTIRGTLLVPGRGHKERHSPQSESADMVLTDWHHVHDGDLLTVQRCHILKLSPSSQEKRIQ